jgi:hypothetical protein
MLVCQLQLMSKNASGPSRLYSDLMVDLTMAYTCRLIRRQLKTETRAIVVQLLGGDR